MRSRQLSAISYQFVFSLIVMTMIGCGGPPPEPVIEASFTPQPATKKAERALPVVFLPKGRPLLLELAITPEEIAQGLMFRTSLPDHRGMLFLFKEERVPSFWMKDTLIPLDMVFLSPEGVIVDIIENAQPCKTDPCPQYVANAPAMAVLEVAAGVVKATGLENGLRLYFKRVPGYPQETPPG